MLEKIIKLIMNIIFGKKSETNEEPKKSNVEHSKIMKSWILSKHEKKMFWLLRELAPNDFVFIQVSLGEILWTKLNKTRMRFNQKRADFVLCDTEFNIKAIIELDDSSHDGREEKDAQRDAMLKEAGYTVLRYRGVPDRKKLRADIENL